MLAFKDFAPRIVRPGTTFREPEWEALEAALEAANRWITEVEVDVVNVETVVLPNMWARHEEGTTDASLGSHASIGTTWHQFIRVWHRRPPG